MFSHFVFGSDDPTANARFYAAVLPLLGFAPLAGSGGQVFARDGALPWIVVARPADGRVFRRGNGYHVAFHAADERTVRRFHAAGLAAGGSDEGGPGLRERYAADYYGAYLRDPAGNKLQAVTFLDGRKAGPGGDIVSHITLGCDDPPAALAFYQDLLAPLGLVRLPAEDTADEDRAFGRPGCAVPIVYAQRPFDGRPAAPPHGSYAVLRAPGRDAVEAFHRAGTGLGGRSLAAPGETADAGPPGLAAGIADLAGNPLYACCPTAP